MSALRLAGYDYVVSIEHEDALIAESPGKMYWTQPSYRG
jgi:sugar phosphate isomerase/epimerase